MKSTKVQTLGANTAYIAYYANARARKMVTPRMVAVCNVTRGAVSSRSNTG